MPRQPAPRARPSPPSSPLRDFGDDFANPGNLQMRSFVPADLPANAPLVVVLHGCRQDAAGYDHAAGWSRRAAASGFALLFPEQVAANNSNGCFNWFEPGDTRRGAGEAASIAAAAAAMVARYRLDPARVFVTGLSAGGAMASVLLATYPDRFAGGAVIAGLPFGAAASVGEAFGAMQAPAAASSTALADRVRAASTFTGPWPRVSVWHGDADRTVAVANGRQVAAQWAAVHGATTTDDRVWRNAGGVPVVELNEIAGMGHGTPLDRGSGDIPAPFMLDVCIASTARIAAFFGIAAPEAAAAPRPAKPASSRATAGAGQRSAARQANPVTTAIDRALRAAGLLR